VALCQRRQVNTLNGEGFEVTRRIRAIALLVALLVIPGALAEVNIDPANRMRNRPPGRCGWCALETLGRHHQIKDLYGLVDGHESTANPEDLVAVLNKLRIDYKLQNRGDHDTALLKSCCASGLGAVVGFRPLVDGGGGHIVTLVEFTDDIVKVIDSNDQDCHVRTMSTERFLHWWDGFTLVVQPKRDAKK
jgi:hypothetical protein